MTDSDLVEKKLAHIESCLVELETEVDPDEIPRDIRAERFAEHTLQIAIQAAQGTTVPRLFPPPWWHL